MVPVIPTDLPNSSVHQISVDTLTALQTKVSNILSTVATQLNAQTEKTQHINKRIQEIDEKLMRVIDSEADFVYQCPNGYLTEDEQWDFKPLFKQDLSATNQKEDVLVDLNQLGEWDKNNNLDSADLYNFYLGTQMETVDRRNSTVRVESPKVQSSLNSIIELRQQSSQYFKVVEPVEVLNNIYEDAIASQQMSEKQSIGFSTTLTQSSLISTNSQSRSQVLKRRRDNRRKNQSRQSPVSSLLRGYNRSRQTVTPVSSRSPQNEIGIEEEANLGIVDSSIVQKSFTEGMCRSPSWKLLHNGSGGSGSNGKEPMPTLSGRSKSLNKTQLILSPKKQQGYIN